MTTPIKEVSQKDGPVVMLNLDPPGTVLFDGLRVETDEKMIQFSCVFGLLSMLTIVIDKLVNRLSSVCRRINRFICVSDRFLKYKLQHVLDMYLCVDYLRGEVGSMGTLHSTFTTHNYFQCLLYYRLVLITELEVE